MPNTSREAPARPQSSAPIAGNECSASHRAAQRFPTIDSPASHLRNALAIAELLELNRRDTTVGRALADIETRVAAALELLESPAQALEQADGFAREQLAEMERTNRELAELPSLEDFGADDRPEG